MDAIAWIKHNGIRILAWGVEFLTILFCLHSSFGERIRVRLSIIAMTVSAVIISALVQGEIFPKYCTVFLYVTTFIYAFRIFQRKFLETCGRFVMGIIATGAIEILVTYIMKLLNGYIGWGNVSFLVANIICLCVAIIFYLQMVRKKLDKIIFGGKKAIVVISIGSLSILFLVIDYHFRGELDQIYYLAFIGLLIIACAYWMKAQEAQFQLEKKNLEMEFQEVYGTAYKELLSEVRRRQHDFVNQLGAIYSMHITATTLEELIERQREYGAVLLEQCRFDKILTGCNNQILAGYLYYKCMDFEKKGVIVKYRIHVDQAECRVALHELIELLGILMTNAAENITGCGEDSQVMELLVEENGSNLIIEVSNQSQYIDSQKAEKLFQEGYSTKGKDRGLGLTRVNQIAEKSCSDIVIENNTKAGKNWVSFRIVIPKGMGK